MIDKLFSILLILNATGLFSFIAPQVGVSIGQVSLALLWLNVFYLLTKTKYLLMIVRHPWMKICLFVILAWPLFTAIYAPSFEVRTIGLQLYYVTLFLCAVVYTVANGLPAMHRLVTISLFLSIFGLVMSMIAPQYFEQVSQLAEAKTRLEGRAFGFLLQPNQLATSLVLLFIAWFSLWRWKSTGSEIMATLVFMLFVLVTGSRTGMLVASMVVLLIYVSALQRGKVPLKTLVKTGVAAICFLCVVIGTKAYISNMEYTDTRRSELFERMETLLSFKLTPTGKLMDARSLQLRVMAQEVYWSLFNEKPILGHGLGADTYYKERGVIFLSAHSDALTTAMEYGVLYPLAFSLLMLHLYKRNRRHQAEVILQTNSIVQFVLACLSIFIFSGGLWDSRTFYVVWGMFFAVVYWRDFFFIDTLYLKQLN